MGVYFSTVLPPGAWIPPQWCNGVATRCHESAIETPARSWSAKRSGRGNKDTTPYSRSSRLSCRWTDTTDLHVPLLCTAAADRHCTKEAAVATEPQEAEVGSISYLAMSFPLITVAGMVLFQSIRGTGGLVALTVFRTETDG